MAARHLDGLENSGFRLPNLHQVRCADCRTTRRKPNVTGIGMLKKSSILRYLPDSRFIYPFVTVLCISCAGFFVFHHIIFGFETGENVAHVDWLPSTASRICWWRNSLNRAVEFDMNEKDFLAWATSEQARNEFNIAELTSIGMADREKKRNHVPRYLHFLDSESRAKAGLPPELPVEIANMDFLRLTDKEIRTARNRLSVSEYWRAEVRIYAAPERGWLYDEQTTRADAVNRLVYDSDQGRAFYFWCPR